MKQKNSRKEKAAATKKIIFETAVQLIKSKGYYNITVSEICKTAKIAKGSFYLYYNAKEDIVRESYYADMGEYIQEHYNAFTSACPTSSRIERIIYFLNLECAFAEYTGYELTCLAYALNLNACLPGPSEHTEKRFFSKILYDEIAQSPTKSVFSCDEIYCYLESMIRGLMATWCFSNQSFSIVSYGKKYIDHAVYSIYQT
ncbi:TetR/AcrR family transcriptional regulator [Anaerosinus massiliensis]|uniref:TetR/AcrR family transcriptional regulator n=1 Tax=Massilibacillus massiliensis TaxID=1806837 RepID=UPI000DA60BA3|nr:TetR/AcrR family transcriptional regulator [Massilibacillus massiliensis]